MGNGTLPCRFQMGSPVYVGSLNGFEPQEGNVIGVHFLNDGTIRYDIKLVEEGHNGLHVESLYGIDQIRVKERHANHDTRAADHQRLLEKQQARDEQRRREGYTGMSKRNGS